MIYKLFTLIKQDNHWKQKKIIITLHSSSLQYLENRKWVIKVTMLNSGTNILPIRLTQRSASNQVSLLICYQYISKFIEVKQLIYKCYT